jgi:hypothetical protein
MQDTASENTMTVTYKIVQSVQGRLIVTEPTDIYAWAAASDRATSYIPDRSARYLRPELRNQPKIQGLCGPMFDGFKNGEAVIRYEDQATNDLLSV